MVVDLRSLNKGIDDLHHPIPKLDEMVHVLSGATCFGKGDGTKGYRQFLLSEAARRLTGVVCPIGTFEHLRVPMGLKTAAAYYQQYQCWYGQHSQPQPHADYGHGGTSGAERSASGKAPLRTTLALVLPLRSRSWQHGCPGAQGRTTSLHDVST